MNTTTKGALAAGTAAVLMLGGAGTLAYWSDSATVNGGSISSGALTLEAVGCDAVWTYAAGPGPVTTVVPGDTITKECTFTIGAVGDHLQAAPTLPGTVTFTPAASGTLSLPVSATYEVAGGPLVGNITEANDGDTLTATISVDFPFGTAATVNANDTQGFTKTLDALTVSLTQVDETP